MCKRPMPLSAMASSYPQSHHHARDKRQCCSPLLRMLTSVRGSSDRFDQVCFTSPHSFLLWLMTSGILQSRATLVSDELHMVWWLIWPATA